MTASIRKSDVKQGDQHISSVLTFGEGFLEAFPINMSKYMVWLPVEVSEGQFTEQLIAGKQRKHICKQQIKRCTYVLFIYFGNKINK